MKVKNNDCLEVANNPIKSNEALPMHYDSTFKIVDHTNLVTGEVKKVKLRRQKGVAQSFLQARDLSFDNSSSLTSSNPSKIGDRVSRPPATSPKLSPIFPSSFTTSFAMPLCLPWNESWNEEKTEFLDMRTPIQGSAWAMERSIKKTMYDRRVALRFGWGKGDLLVKDKCCYAAYEDGLCGRV